MDESNVRRVMRGIAVGASLALLVVLAVPSVRAVVTDALNGDRAVDRASTSPSGCLPGRNCSPSAQPTFSPSPSRTDGDPVIAAAGDIACQSWNATAWQCHQRGTSDLLVGRPFNAIIDLGDGQYDSGFLSSYEAYYGPTWGRVKSITRPVPGNHDYETFHASGYYRYFGSAAGEPTKGYNSYDVGEWHIIALNSNCWAVGGCDPGSPQERWLRRDLASHPASCVMAYWHHPRFSSGTVHGSSASSSAFWQALYEGGADVVLTGHEHSYERFAPQQADGRADPSNGIREFVVGTGGASHYPLGAPIANSEVRDNTTFGVLELTLHRGGYDWRFLPEAGGAFSDSGSAACHQGSEALGAGSGGR